MQVINLLDYMIRLFEIFKNKKDGIKNQICYSVSTNSGLIREDNQDNFYVMENTFDKSELSDYRRKGVKKLPVLFAVCDGMGGEAFGEKASFLASSKLSCIDLESLALKSREEIERELITAFQAINNDIYYTYSNVGRVVGCTMTLLYADETNLFVLNVGDSPGIRYRDGGYKLITYPDNHANQLYVMGKITEEERWTHKTKSQLTQCLGMNPTEVALSPHVYYEPFPKTETTYVLCSDGLVDGMGLKEIGKTIFEDIGADNVAAQLVKCAVNGGSKDNVTALVIRL